MFHQLIRNRVVNSLLVKNCQRQLSSNLLQGPLKKIRLNSVSIQPSRSIGWLIGPPPKPWTKGWVKHWVFSGVVGFGVFTPFMFWNLGYLEVTLEDERGNFKPGYSLYFYPYQREFDEEQRKLNEQKLMSSTLKPEQTEEVNIIRKKWLEVQEHLRNLDERWGIGKEFEDLPEHVQKERLRRKEEFQRPFLEERPPSYLSDPIARFQKRYIEQAEEEKRRIAAAKAEQEAEKLEEQLNN